MQVHVVTQGDWCTSRRSQIIGGAGVLSNAGARVQAGACDAAGTANWGREKDTRVHSV